MTEVAERGPAGGGRRGAFSGFSSLEPASASGGRGIPLDGSAAALLDADQVPGRITERTVADAVRLLSRLLDDLGVARLHSRERAIGIRGGQVDPTVGAGRLTEAPPPLVTPR